MLILLKRGPFHKLPVPMCLKKVFCAVIILVHNAILDSTRDMLLWNVIVKSNLLFLLQLYSVICYISVESNYHADHVHMDACMHE